VAPITRAWLDFAAQASMVLVLRGVEYRCWRCTGTTVAPALIHPEGLGFAGVAVDLSDEPALGYARDVLALEGHPIAATVRPRWSRTAQSTYLSCGCLWCDALFGRFFIEEMVSAARACEEIGGLPVLAQTRRPLIEWWLMQACG